MRDPAVTLHFAELPEDDIAQRTGFRLTTVARSLIDVAAGPTDEDQLERAIQEARDAHLLTIRQLRARAENVNTKAALRIERALQRADAP
jgi:hypothetical protein